MEFVFAPAEQADKRNLLQGDLLVRNDGLRTVLAEAHGYYATAEDYRYFLVLTQSCDLVRRGGRRPKSRYITLAAARPLSLVVDRLLAKTKFDFDFPIMLCQKDHETRARQLLERLLHNTEDGLFFLKRESHPALDEDLCVFLALSVALRADHYDACLQAKIGQLDQIFSAKVGWLTGNMYSRVATPDVEEEMDGAEEFKETFYREALLDRTAWLNPPQLRELKDLVKRWRKAKPGEILDEDAAKQILEEVPSNKELAVGRILKLLVEAKIVEGGSAGEASARNLLLSDQYLGKLFS